MCRRQLAPLIVLAALCVASSAAWAADTLTKKKTGDGEQTRISGTVESIGSEEVTIKDGTGKSHTVAVNDIESLRYEQEPRSMFLARNAAIRGAYEEAIKMFSEFQEADLTLPEAKVDKDFYLAYCATNLALTGTGKLEDAEKQLGAFVTANPTSYHSLEASQMWGDVLTLLGNFPGAEKAYDKLIGSRVMGYKMSGSVAKAYALVKQNKLPEAQKVFESVQSMGSTENPQDMQQRHAANLGRATCIAKGGNMPEAIKIIEDVIEKADEDGQLYARAYNTLGSCYLATNNPKEALLAYLRVDVLYNTVPQERAEALLQLNKLWTKLDMLPNSQERAKDCVARLKSLYPTSPQARSLGG